MLPLFLKEKQRTMRTLLILSFMLTTTYTAVAQEPDSKLLDAISLRGYIKTMPSLQTDKDFNSTSFGNLLHNRLNFRANISPSLDLRLEGRNRMIYNESFRDIPNVEDLMGQDDGLADLSWVWLSEDAWIGHTEIDRLYMNWRTDSWQIRVGRQRVNWGINLVSNPNDLFNTYSFFDFDYIERPGTDAVRVQHYLSGLSSIELAVSPAKRSRETVAAVRYTVNASGYDLQTLAGYYRDRLALGGGWAGHIGGAGFKGEATWFFDRVADEHNNRSNLVAAAGVDYMFSGGTFAVAEVLYNGGHERTPGHVFQITEPLRPDNIMFSTYAITLSADHGFSPIIRGGVSFMSLPDIGAAFLMPQCSYSLRTNLDVELVGQLFFGGKNTIFEQAGHAVFASLQYSF